MIGDLLGAIGDAIAWTVNAILDALAWIANAVLDFPDWSVAALAWVVDALEALSATAWVLLALGLGLLWYVWLSIRYVGMLGPVKVTLQGDGSAATGLAARLTDELMSKGLLPGPVPAGSPAATVVAAIAASPVPQATWLGKLLEMGEARLPRPRNYEITGTLMSRTGEAGVPADKCCGVTYTLTGTPRPSLVDANTLWANTHVEALKELASVVYMKVSLSSETVFPPWARWWKRAAFDDYVAGVAAEPPTTASTEAKRSAIGTAVANFDAARAEQPENWMPAIRAANLRETRAAIAFGRSQRQWYQAEALLQYLDVAKHARTVAEARYRASVLLASLSLAPGEAYPRAVAPLLRDGLNLGSAASAEAISYEVKSRALQESRKTRNLLRWWGVPLKAGRLRSRFEPRGCERRQFLKAVKISRRCINEQIGWHHPWDKAAVRFAFLLRWKSAGWQAHYNAACFFALRNEAESALKHLERAVADPESGVSRFWLERDPDLIKLPRNADWCKIAERT